MICPFERETIRPWRSWISQWIPIPKAGGSNPSGRTKNRASCASACGALFLVRPGDEAPGFRMPTDELTKKSAVCVKTPPKGRGMDDGPRLKAHHKKRRTADAYLSGRTIWRFKILCSASVPHVPVHDRFRLYPFGQNAACRRNAEAVGSECQRDRRVFGIFQCILFFTLIQKILFRESFQICITRIMREVLV